MLAAAEGRSLNKDSFSWRSDDGVRWRRVPKQQPMEPEQDKAKTAYSGYNEEPEEMMWRDDNTDSRERLPSAKYTRLTEGMRHLVSGTTQCAMFCRGQRCKYCSSQWPTDATALAGIYSHWVTPNILAMARPTAKAITDFNLIDVFKQAQIRSIFNLQQPGEHATCGPNQLLGHSMFSYDPQQFMDNGMFFYNYPWQDYNVGTQQNILDIVKVFHFAVQEGKVAVHCHAGLGRTGVLIACYLIYANRISANEAINYVRSKRPGSIQTRGQILSVQTFQQYLQPLRQVFAYPHDVRPAEPDCFLITGGFTLNQFLTRQRNMLHGMDTRLFKYLPKLIFHVCNQLLLLARRDPIGINDLAIITQHGNMGQIAESSGTDLLREFLLNKRHVASLHKAQSMQQLNRDTNHDQNGQMESAEDGSDEGRRVGGRRGRREENVSEKDDRKRILGRYGSLSSVSGLQGTLEAISFVSRLMRNRAVLGRSTSGGQLTRPPSTTPRMRITSVHALSVAEALSQTEPLAESVRASAHLTAQRINQGCNMWTLVSTESNPAVLVSLLYNWLDTLQEPVVNAQWLQQLSGRGSDRSGGKGADSGGSSMQDLLNSLERGARAVILFLAEFMANLEPIEVDYRDGVIHRLLSSLSHRNLTPLPTSLSSQSIAEESDVDSLPASASGLQTETTHRQKRYLRSLSEQDSWQFKAFFSALVSLFQSFNEFRQNELRTSAQSV